MGPNTQGPPTFIGPKLWRGSNHRSSPRNKLVPILIGGPTLIGSPKFIGAPTLKGAPKLIRAPSHGGPKPSGPITIESFTQQSFLFPPLFSHLFFLFLFLFLLFPLSFFFLLFFEGGQAPPGPPGARAPLKSRGLIGLCMALALSFITYKHDFSTVMEKLNPHIWKILFPISCFERHFFKTWFPPNRSSKFFLYQYVSHGHRLLWYEFRFGPHSSPDFAQLHKTKTGKLGLISMTQKIDTIIDFFLIRYLYFYHCYLLDTLFCWT